MPYFTATQVEQITTILGYASAPHLIAPQLANSYLSAAVERVAQILIDLAEIDAQLKALRPDSMAESVAGMQLNFPKHRALLKSDASDLLKELAQVLGIPLLSKKYAGSARATVSYW
ncbi:MAG TPA: hypothetical protein V6D10_17685 [Trichocoleus sp.]|jgi:hypothetical protein